MVTETFTGRTFTDGSWDIKTLLGELLVKGKHAFLDKSVLRNYQIAILNVAFKENTFEKVF